MNLKQSLMMNIWNIGIYSIIIQSRNEIKCSIICILRKHFLTLHISSAILSVMHSFDIQNFKINIF